jgi:hypothetical protein
MGFEQGSTALLLISIGERTYFVWLMTPPKYKPNGLTPSMKQASAWIDAI